MSEKDYNFQKLTPTEDVDLKIYKNALDFVFENDDIKNVGITGPYSSGKSSILESYKAIHKEKRFLHISLANFASSTKVRKQQEGQGQQGNNENDVDINENILEGKILNQLIHQINVKNIPQTNFRVKQYISKKKVALDTGCILSFCFFFVMLILTSKPILQLISAALLIPPFAFLTYNAILLQKNKCILKKISIQGNAVEIFELNDDSYFDKYLNEVLYLFEHSGSDVIVFEDLDRYEANQIFQRLREINSLINNHKKEELPIRFFYLLRDDIFLSKDRTKFFDFIIPVVPILDGSNSYDKFITLFKDGGIFEIFEESFLQDISLYVDDMRILKNIYNEFIIYNKQINTTEQNANKLFAIIIYKNLFPRDFSDLQLGKGFIHTIFGQKKAIIEEQVQKLQDKIKVLNDETTRITSETLKSESEIDLLYSNPPKVDNYGRLTGPLEKERDERIELLRKRDKGKIENNKTEISNLEQQIIAIQNNKISQLISNININQINFANEIGEINDFREIKSNEYFDLLKYLIRYGYIDETYSDYMTYFYENSLSRIDKIFIRSITDEKAKEFSYELKDPEKVVCRLRVVDFEKIETLNFDLLSYLLKNQQSYKEKIDTFSNQLKNVKNLNFIEQFFISGKEIILFIKFLNLIKPKSFIDIINSNLDQKQIREYIILSLYYSEDQELEIMNIDGELSEYIATQSDFLQIEDPNIDRLIKVFELINVCFIYISYEHSNTTLWNAVYSNSLYEINIDMIRSILKNRYEIAISNDYDQKNFSLIISKPDEPLAKYVKNNIDQYLKVMLPQCHETISDNEEAVLYIFNNAKNKEHLVNYIKYLDTKITLLKNINDIKLWPKLIEQNLILFSADNVFSYYFSNEQKLDETIIDFINEHQNEPFDFDYKIEEKFVKNGDDALFESVIKCNSLEAEAYRKIIRELGIQRDSCVPLGIDTDKINILIDLGIIQMTSEMLLFMRDNYETNLSFFIKSNIPEYVEQAINENNFSMNEAYQVLDFDVNEKYKIRLLEFTDEPINIQSGKYSTTINEYILQNNFNGNDLQYVIQNYNNNVVQNKDMIENLASQNIDRIISKRYIFSYNLLDKLISIEDLQIDEKLDLFSIALPQISKIECINALEKMEQEDFLSLFDGKRPKFENTDVNGIILDIFEERGWITHYREDGTNFFRAYGKKSA